MPASHKIHPNNICSVILAAGLSSRMGRFKPLLNIDGVPAIKHLIRTSQNAGIDNLIVVVGHKSDELIESIKDENVTIVYNPDFKEGMFTSITAGIKRAMEFKNIHAFLLFPVDVPLVSADIVKILLDSYDGKCFAVPCYKGKKGHPLLIPVKYVDEIVNHDGTNGLKGITSKYDDCLLRIETDNESVVLDMDKPEDYEEIVTFFDKLNSCPSEMNITDETDFKGCLYLVRHGNTKLHKEKIFMGQVDVSLSEEGRKQAQTAADTLAEERPNTKFIYSSPLLRARESAEIIRNRFLENNDEKKIIEIPQFMEISLGDWDGRYINEIKDEYPEEYEKRGLNILTYKRYPDGENHYDLKYRVIKELKKIMINTDSEEDIIIVSHKGVINVIRECILDLDSITAISYNPPKGSVTKIDMKITD